MGLSNNNYQYQFTSYNKYNNVLGVNNREIEGGVLGLSFLQLCYRPNYRQKPRNEEGNWKRKLFVLILLSSGDI